MTPIQQRPISSPTVQEAGAAEIVNDTATAIQASILGYPRRPALAAMKYRHNEIELGLRIAGRANVYHAGE